jgi:hypothetical protein
MALPPLAKRYAKSLCHLNHARRTRRLGLILGAGISDDLEIPRWTQLIAEIETQLSYKSGTAPESYRAEQLFRHYRKKKIHELGWPGGEPLDAAVATGWREIVAKCLYKNFFARNGKLDLTAYQDKIKKHPYLVKLGKLAHEAQLVVNHNFDDALEVAIDLDPSILEPPNRKYYSFWRPEPFLRRGMVNIYHPNGFTPLRSDVRGSESLVLTEASFADHLANPNTEESHFLLRHLADKTCLIIGHSLADGTLKNALRQHANQRPAHVNYYLHWTRHGEASLSNDQKDAIREANFETYNLVTMFVDSSDIAELLSLVSMAEDELEGHLAHHGVPSRYVYYVVGSVSAGKSTTLRHLRDLATIEEWPSRMPKIMNRPSVGLKKAQERNIDEELEDAIWVKNREIRNIKTGIVAVDRAPLDFIAFPKKTSESLGATARKRGTPVLQRLEAGKFRDLCPGQVILLHAQTEALLTRQLQRGGRTKLAEVENGSAGRYLELQRDRLDEIYRSAAEAGSSVRSDFCSIATTVKYVARIIHFGDYKPFEFVKRLRRIQKGK